MGLIAALRGRQDRHLLGRPEVPGRDPVDSSFELDRYFAGDDFSATPVRDGGKGLRPGIDNARPPGIPTIESLIGVEDEEED